MCISILPIELSAELADECSSGLKGKHTNLHSFVESGEFNKPAAIWGLCLW